MILIKRLDTPTCDNKSCNKRALYQFTDAKEADDFLRNLSKEKNNG